MVERSARRPDEAASAPTPSEPDATGPVGDETAEAPVAGAAIEAEVARLRERVTELEDQWRRALADLDNLRKRTVRDSARQREDERSRVAAEWLPVLDNLDLALEHAQADPESVLDGVRAVREQALAILERLGFPRQDDVGASFDPSRHEAVATVPDAEAPAGTIVHVVRPGYGGDGSQLRPAAVVVATKGE